MREEEKITSLDSKWKRIIRKKWVLPSVYIASAALILTGVLWYQAATGNLWGDDDVNDANNVADQYSDLSQQDAVPVNAAAENFKMPVLDEKSVVIKKQFYDYDASSEEQEAALVFYNNTYYPSTGIDIAQENGESFDVVASLSGTVVRAENDSILGNVIEIEHENGVTTYYQSLDEMHVEAGASVDQGDVIGTAGTSVYNKDAGIHVHFEIRQNNEPVNPVDYFNKPVSSLEKSDENNAKTEESTEQPNAEGSTETPSTEKATETEQPGQSDQPAVDQTDQPSDQPENSTDTQTNSNVNDKAEDKTNTNTKDDASISQTRA